MSIIQDFREFSRRSLGLPTGIASSTSRGIFHELHDQLKTYDFQYGRAMGPGHGAPSFFFRHATLQALEAPETREKVSTLLDAFHSLESLGRHAPMEAKMQSYFGSVLGRKTGNAAFARYQEFVRETPSNLHDTPDTLKPKLVSVITDQGRSPHPQAESLAESLSSHFISHPTLSDTRKTYSSQAWQFVVSNMHLQYGSLLANNTDAFAQHIDALKHVRTVLDNNNPAEFARLDGKSFGEIAGLMRENTTPVPTTLLSNALT